MRGEGRGRREENKRRPGGARALGGEEEHRGAARKSESNGPQVVHHARGRSLATVRRGGAHRCGEEESEWERRWFAGRSSGATSRPCSEALGAHHPGSRDRDPRRWWWGLLRKNGMQTGLLLLYELSQKKTQEERAVFKNYKILPKKRI